MSAAKQAPARILHIASSFAPGETTSRTLAVAAGIAAKAHHIFVSADPDAIDGLRALPRAVKHTIQPDFPSLSGLPLPGRLQKIAKAMKGFDLVLTYGWGAMDAVMAHTLFSEALGLPRLVHHEDEAMGASAPQGLAQTWYRRVALGKASGLVVPTEALEEKALVDWQQPLGRVKHIPAGIDVAAFGGKRQPDAIPRLLKRPGERWVGTFASMDGTEQLDVLVAAFASLAENWHLVICGDGPAREQIEQTADRLEQNHRVHIVSAQIDTAKVAGLFDIYAQAHEGGSHGIIKAMAAACPIVAPARTSASFVSEQNTHYLAATMGAEDIETELVTFAIDDKLRQSVGKANRAKARSDFDQAKMLATYGRLYTSAMQRDL